MLEKASTLQPFFFICNVLLMFLWVTSCRPGKPVPEDYKIEDECTYLYDICTDSLTLVEHTIKSGDNLSIIFERLGFSAAMGDRIYRECADYIDPRKIRAGLSFHTLSKQDSTEAIQYIIVEKSQTDHVIIDLTNEKINVYPYQKEITLRQSYMEGSVRTSLWNEIKRQGVDPILAINLSDIFAWQIDFFTIQENDSFQVLYTAAFIEDSIPLNIASIDGAIFTYDGKPYMAIPFMQDSIMEYFDSEGQSLRKAFLKAPLDFFRISSLFSNSRFHPVLKRYRAHHGVDYAAPSGTPVKTIGNGKVIAKGYQRGGGGNHVKIQHNTTYTTSYMHLRGFAKGLQVGKQVQQGEVIGYVGSTGLSTGPHLDFRVYKNGKPIDPLKIESPPSHPVKTELKDSFERVKQEVLLKIDELRKNDTINYTNPNEQLPSQLIK